MLDSKYIEQPGTYKKRFSIFFNTLKKYTDNQIPYSKIEIGKLIFLTLNYSASLFDNQADNANKYIILVKIAAILLCGIILLKKYFQDLPLFKSSKMVGIAFLIILPIVNSILFVVTKASANALISMTLYLLIATDLLNKLMAFSAIALHVLLITLFMQLGNINNALILNNPNFSIVIALLLSTFIIMSIPKEKKLDEVQKFASRMAHEIANLLGHGKSYASMLKTVSRYLTIVDELDDYLLLKAEKSIYIKMQNSLKNLIEMSNEGIEQINRMIKTMRSKFNMEEFTPLSVVNEIKDAINSYGLTNNRISNINLSLEENFTFYGSSTAFKLLIFNIFKNSYNYSGENCKINMWTQQRKIFIQDNGPGIDKKALPHIFDKFYSTDITGTGLGLSFCKQTMALFGGTIHCQTSTEQDKSHTTIILDFD
jgi:signal transduction histidine kinase